MPKIKLHILTHICTRTKLYLPGGAACMITKNKLHPCTIIRDQGNKIVLLVYLGSQLLTCDL